MPVSLTPADPPLDPEDAKIVTLARSARARVGAAEGAAVRDTDGRTYAAATVALPSLRLTALQAAVAAAVSSGRARPGGGRRRHRGRLDRPGVAGRRARPRARPRRCCAPTPAGTVLETLPSA